MSIDYAFPLITRIQDVLPHIQDKPEFVVAERGPLTIINYMFAEQNSFPKITDSNNSLKERILRECRGLIFDTETGLIKNRRYHKFFNYGERDDISFDPVYQKHEVYDKLDGSMVSPIWMENKNTNRAGWRFATKMGITSVSMQVETYLTSLPSPEREEYYNFFDWMRLNNCTPIFEWMSRKNRIVLDYGEGDHLILTGIRKNATGEYIPYHEKNKALSNWKSSFPYLKPSKERIDSIQEFVNRTRSLKNKEGFIIRTEMGHMIKFKTDEYVLFHKTKDSLSRECDVAKICLEENVDDFLPCLHDKDRDFVRKFNGKVMQKFRYFVGECVRERSVWDDRKEFALHYPASLSKQAIFAIWNDKEEPINAVRKVLLSYCENQKKFETLKTELFPDLPKMENFNQ
jgi:RNA ligase